MAIEQPSRFVLTNGRIWTGVAGAPWAEAVAVCGGRIAAVGRAADMPGVRGGPGAETIDLKGRLVLPGFTDCHTHFLAGGFALASIKLRSARSRDEFVRRVADCAAGLAPGRWILNGDWDHQGFDRPELPRREWLDPVTAGHPVFVNRLDWHMALADSRALHLAGITAATPDPAGGEIVRDPLTGQPTGILKDAAMDLVARVIPPLSLDEKLEAAGRALAHAARNGVTAVHEMADAASFEAFEELDRCGRLTARLHVYIPITQVGLLSALRLKSPFGSPRLKLAGLKGFVDGSLGSSTACFFESYSDDPGRTGLFHEQMFPEGMMEERIGQADRAGLQVAVHAIGDRANKVILDIFEKVMAVNGPRDRRWRIEHAQHLRPEDVARFGRLGVIASVQPYHLIDDGRWAEGRIGPERAAGAFVYRSLLDAGTRLVFGSDWTVAPLDPLAGIYAAATRRVPGGAPEGWHPEQRISVEEAVRAYTAGAAYAGFMENESGTIEPGKGADLVVLDRDIFEIPVEEIAETRVAATIAGGRMVFRKDV